MKPKRGHGGAIDHGDTNTFKWDVSSKNRMMQVPIGEMTQAEAVLEAARVVAEHRLRRIPENRRLSTTVTEPKWDLFSITAAVTVEYVVKAERGRYRRVVASVPFVVHPIGT